MQCKEFVAKGASISKAMMIIDEGLKSSLDMKVGGELPKNLAALYDYMNQRLLHANLNNDPTVLDEVSGLLSELKGAWEAIRPKVQNASTDEALPISRTVSTGITNSATPQSAIGKQAALMYGRM
jgi:flagellar protein FliS